MGKSADAVFDGDPFGYVSGDAHAQAAFLAATRSVQQQAESCDGMLSLCSLAPSATKVLLQASGEKDPNAFWLAAKVLEMHQRIDWSRFQPADEWERNSVASAKAFLQTCAEQGYAIKFDA